ncbi:MAG: hypothetical protein IPL53_20195 [Ignavibacteria bacterium]|nr:hypothetical protein [Ignavibacteria bacterium]
MKTFLHATFFFLFTFLLSVNAFSANEQFRSIASGNWNSNSTWQMSTNNGSTWIAATRTPNDSSNVITVRSPNTVTVTVNVNADRLVVDGGATVSISNGITLTILDSSGTDLNVSSNAVISGTGTVRTQGADVTLSLSSNSTFNVALNINSGKCSTINTGYSPIFKGLMIIDQGATMQNDGQPVRFEENVTNNGTLGNGAFLIACALFTNNGSVTSNSLNTDTAAHTIAGTGSFSYLTILSGSVVSFASNLKFNGTSIVINTGGTIANSTTMKTEGNTSLTIYSGVNFNGTLNVISGTTATINTGYSPIFKGLVIIDQGATMQNDGQPVRLEGNVTNNGNIGNGSFYIACPLFTNNGSVTSSSLNTDTAAHTIAGTGSFSYLTILPGSVVSFAANLKFNGTYITINTGGTIANATTMKTEGNTSLTIYSGETSMEH